MACEAGAVVRMTLILDKLILFDGFITESTDNYPLLRETLRVEVMPLSIFLEITDNRLATTETGEAFRVIVFSLHIGGGAVNGLSALCADVGFRP